MGLREAILRNTPVNFQGKTDYDSDFCGSIPLNYINIIQAHGVLLVLHRNSFAILQVSENAPEILGVAIEQLLQQPLHQFISQEHHQQLTQKLHHPQAHSHVSSRLLWQANQKPFSATLHMRDHYLLLELEEVVQTSSENLFAATCQDISHVIGSLKEAASVEEASRISATELQRLSGFDRVMVYRFDENWNGTVIAEAQAPDMAESYLGLRFPASDVPKQARDLYFRTPFRIIPHACGATARLHPVINPVTSSLTDISDCILRGVPLVHAEYLQNMGVEASMSTPIIIDNQLWGLISCHHRQPKQISFELRTSFEIISGIVAAQISTREKEESFGYRSFLHGIELKLMEQLYTRKHLVAGLLENPSYLLDLLGVQGLVLVINNDYRTVGEVPDERMVRSLIKWLSRYNKEKILLTDSLPRLFEEAVAYRDLASGLFALQINGTKNYLLGFRPEVIKSVNWGGNPNEAINFEPGSKRYHPRNSFNLWREQVELTSHSWRPEVMEVAQHVRTAILEKLLKEEEIF